MFKWILNKISALIVNNLKLFIAKEINGKLDKIYKKVNKIEKQTDKNTGKLEIIEKIILKNVIINKQKKEEDNNEKN